MTTRSARSRQTMKNELADIDAEIKRLEERKKALVKNAEESNGIVRIKYTDFLALESTAKQFNTVNEEYYIDDNETDENDLEFEGKESKCSNYKLIAMKNMLASLMNKAATLYNKVKDADVVVVEDNLPEDYSIEYVHNDDFTTGYVIDTSDDDDFDIECLENDEIGDRYPVLITEENVSVIPDENDINRR